MDVMDRVICAGAATGEVDLCRCWSVRRSEGHLLVTKDEGIPGGNTRDQATFVCTAGSKELSKALKASKALGGGGTPGGFLTWYAVTLLSSPLLYTCVSFQQVREAANRYTG